MTTNLSPTPDMTVQYKLAPDAPEATNATLAFVLAEYLDEKLPSATVVDMNQQGQFVPVDTMIRSYPRLVANRSIPVLTFLTVGSIGLFLVWQGATALVLHALVFALLLVGVVLIQRDPRLRSRSGLRLLRELGRGWVALLLMGGLEATAAAMSARLYLHDIAGQMQLEAALQSDDPCSLQGLDPATIQENNSGDYAGRIKAKSWLCANQNRPAEQRASEAGQRQQCIKAVDAIREKRTVSLEELTDSRANVLVRLSRGEVEPGDLALSPSKIPCQSVPATWQTVVDVIRGSTFWGTFKSVPTMSSDMKSRLSRDKLEPAAASAFKQSVEAVVAENQSKPASELGPTADLCDLFGDISPVTSPACRSLMLKHNAFKAKEAREFEMKEARCDAIHAAYGRCVDRCNELESQGRGNAAMTCDQQCDKQLGRSKNCP